MSNISYSAIITIIFYEIKNFFKEYQFNVLAPLVNTLLFILILSTIYNYYSFDQTENSYIYFLVPGVIMAVVMQTSFSHMSEVIISMKQIGSFNDLLVSPISRIEIYFSFIFSSVIVCLFIAIFNTLIISIFLENIKINFLFFFYYLIIGIIIFSSFGAVTGFLSNNWDTQSSISNFFIMPISFFSSNFFSISALDDNFKFLFLYNPFYYLVNGFRNSFYNDFEKTFSSSIYIEIVCLITLIISLYIFKKGYKVIN